MQSDCEAPKTNSQIRRIQQKKKTTRVVHTDTISLSKRFDKYSAPK